MLDYHHSSGWNEAIHQTSSFAHVERVWELYQAKYGDLSLCMNLFSLHFVLWAIRIRSTSTLLWPVLCIQLSVPVTCMYCIC